MNDPMNDKVQQAIFTRAALLEAEAAATALPPGPERRALLAAQRHLHALGITSIQDACVGDAGEISIPDTFATYRSAAADRLLTCRVTGALWWERLRGLHQLDYQLEKSRQKEDRKRC